MSVHLLIEEDHILHKITMQRPTPRLPTQQADSPRHHTNVRGEGLSFHTVFLAEHAMRCGGVFPSQEPSRSTEKGFPGPRGGR